MLVLCVLWSPTSADITQHKQTSARPTVIIVCKLFSLFFLFLPLCIAAKIFKDAWGKERPRLFVALCIINKRDTFWFNTLTVRLSAQLHFSTPISSPSVGCLRGDREEQIWARFCEKRGFVSFYCLITKQPWSDHWIQVWWFDYVAIWAPFIRDRQTLTLAGAWFPVCCAVIVFVLFCLLIFPAEASTPLLLLPWILLIQVPVDPSACQHFHFWHRRSEISAFLSHSDTSQRSLCFSLSPAPQLKRSPDTEVLSRRDKQAGPLGVKKKGFGFICVTAAQKLLRTLTFCPKQRPPRWLYGREQAKLTWPGTFSFLFFFFLHLAALWKEHLMFPASDWLFFSWGTE